MFSTRPSLLLGRNRDGLLIGLALLALLFGFFAYIARLNEVTHDAFHEMALAREWFRSGQFPLNDVFAFTPTISPTVHHEWATGVLLYWVAGASPLGLDGMSCLRLILVVAIAGTTYRVARNNGAHPLLIAACAPIAFPMLWVGFSTLRAQIFTLLFLVIQLLLQQSDWRGRRLWIVTWFAMYVAWLNMHAGFVVGLGMLAFHIFERWIAAIGGNDDGSWEVGRFAESSRWSSAYMKLWHHVLIVPLVPLGMLINPWGVQYVPYLLRAIAMPRPTMLEWQPLWMTYDATTTMLTFAMSVLALGYVAKNRQWWRLRGWIFCCLAAFMALKHLRHGSIYAMLWIALIPGWISPTAMGRLLIARIQSRRSFYIGFSTVCIVLFSGFSVSQWIWHARLPADDPNGLMVYPVRACEYVRSHRLHGNMLTPFASGAYVSWTCYPDIRVSIDGRYEVAYRDDVLPKHNRFYDAEPDWESVLDEYSVDWILIQQSAPIRDVIKASKNGDKWKVAYEDQTFVLLGRAR